MAKLAQTLCPKAGSNASNYFEIAYFTFKSISTPKGHHRRECISNNLNHFAELMISYQFLISHLAYLRYP